MLLVSRKTCLLQAKFSDTFDGHTVRLPRPSENGIAAGQPGIPASSWWLRSNACSGPLEVRCLWQVSDFSYSVIWPCIYLKHYFIHLNLCVIIDYYNCSGDSESRRGTSLSSDSGTCACRFTMGHCRTPQELSPLPTQRYKNTVTCTKLLSLIWGRTKLMLRTLSLCRHYCIYGA